MQARDTTKVITYLSPKRAVDRAILAKMRADRARGVAYSETVRRALEAYYERPAPAPDTTAELRALQAQVAALADQVAQLLRLTVELDALRADNARLQLALVGSVYGDKPARNRAALLAAAALEDLKASAGGGDNGRDDSPR